MKRLRDKRGRFTSTKPYNYLNPFEKKLKEEIRRLKISNSVFLVHNAKYRRTIEKCRERIEDYRKEMKDTYHGMYLIEKESNSFRKEVFSLEDKLDNAYHAAKVWKHRYKRVKRHLICRLFLIK